MARQARHYIRDERLYVYDSILLLTNNHYGKPSGTLHLRQEVANSG